MNLTSIIKKLASVSALVPLLQVGLLLAPVQANAQGNSWGDNVICAGAGTCYDFTVYDNKVAGGPGASSKGYFEGFVTYTGSGTVTPTLTNAYFIASGLVTPGATVSSWAPILANPVIDSTLGPSPTLNTATGRFNGSGDYGTVIDFKIGSTFYTIALLSGGTAAFTYSSVSYADALTQGTDVVSSGQLSYTNTLNGVNNAGGTKAFGGQIAPEMSPLLSFNVFALLGCLFLLFTSKKYFVKSKSGTASALSIA